MESLKLLASIGRLHIVAIAALGTFTFGWLFFGVHPWSLAAMTALDWFLVNLLNRVVDLREDRHNGIPGTDFVSAHRRAILAVGLTLLALSFAFGALFFLAITPLRLAFHALGFAYNWPILRGVRRMKELYFWKNTASAIGFLLTVFGYPLVTWRASPFAEGITPITIAIAGAFFFAFELSYEVIYDLRDAEGDRFAGVRTYPVVHGERGAVRIVDALIAASMLALAIGYAAGSVPWRLAVMIVAPAVQLVLYKRALRRRITSGDCVGLTWLGAGLLVAYHLWIAAGLPGVTS